MSTSFYTWKESMAAESHAVLEDGLGIVVSGTPSTRYNFLTAAPAAGGSVDYVTVTATTEAGQGVDVARDYHGDIVQLRCDAAVAYGDDLTVTVAGRFIPATATNTVQFVAMGVGEQGSVIPARRVESFTKA